MLFKTCSSNSFKSNSLEITLFQQEALAQPTAYLCRIYPFEIFEQLFITWSFALASYFPTSMNLTGLRFWLRVNSGTLTLNPVSALFLGEGTCQRSHVHGDLLSRPGLLRQEHTNHSKEDRRAQSAPAMTARLMEWEASPYRLPGVCHYPQTCWLLLFKYERNPFPDCLCLFFLTEI